ncbi:hypothetical protein TNCV_1705291 [Trichonephila clavipes]|uniref:Uncharacterized protein n=1 Tax=Trichonephila clavipes TaxID=2585209 RepID=A0A8X6UYI4_TRICX|nr:hypothetical protein TNCV_1705291 [Trichonephila clavipes]
MYLSLCFEISTTASPRRDPTIYPLCAHSERRAVIENIDKTTEIIDIDRHVSDRRIAQALKIDLKTVLYQLKRWPNQSLDSIPGEDTGVSKSIAHSRHGTTLNIRQAISPIVRLMEEEDNGRPFTIPEGVLPQNWQATDLTCMVLKDTANDCCKMNFLPG